MGAEDRAREQRIVQALVRMLDIGADRVRYDEDGRVVGLSLSYTRLVTLPPEIGQLSALRRLDVSNSKLTSLPATIGQLTVLEELDLRGTGLTSLPSAIGKLTAVQKLLLSATQLTSLPPEIGELAALRTLELGNTKLASLPTEIGRLTALEDLDLRGTGLTSLPPVIGQLTALRWLSLWDTPLTCLPPEIGELTALRYLALKGPELTSLPPEIGRLSALETLNLVETRITRLPPSIGQLTALQMLNLNFTALASLPPEIGQLSALGSLYLSRTALTSLPREIGGLTALRRLDLSHTGLTSLPAEIGELTVLEELDLSQTPLASLPPEIGQLTALQTLDLSQTELTSVPAELGELSALRALYLRDTRLTSLPPELGKLAALQMLGLRGSGVTRLPPELEERLRPRAAAGSGSRSVLAPIMGGPAVAAQSAPDEEAAQVYEAPVRRYADVVAPAQVAPRREFVVRVGLTRTAPADAPEAEAFDVRVTQRQGQPTGAPAVTVTVQAAAFECLGPAEAELAVLPSRASAPAAFRLRSRPGVSGDQQISVSFVQGAEILGRVLVSIRVGARAPTLVERVMRQGPMEGPEVFYGLAQKRRGSRFVRSAGAIADVPDVLIYVERLVVDGGEQLRFRYMWPQVGRLKLSDVGSLQLHNVEAWAREQYEALSRYAQGGGEPTASETALATIGENLYDRLFPPGLKRAYEEFAPRARTILIYSTEPWIPWEIVKPYGLRLAEADSDFLCARFALGRWLTSEETDRVPQRIAVRTVCPVIPPSNLPAAIQERSYLEGLPGRWGWQRLYAPAPRNGRAVLELFAEGKVELYHFATHGQLAASQREAVSVQIGAGQLTPADVSGSAVLRGLVRSAPLVFINACHSARQAFAVSGIGGWADKLLRFGCSGFVGTNWEVDDDLAAAFARHFYDAVSEGQTLGEACRLARLAIRQMKPENSTWLAYVLYGHPAGRLAVGMDAYLAEMER